MSLHHFLAPFTISETTLFTLADRFSHIYKNLAASSVEQFFPTPVTRLPTGREKGRYLAVYVGLFYLRVAFIELLGEPTGHTPLQRQRVRRTLEKAWSIEERLKRDRARELFKWIGDCIAEVVKDRLDGEGEGDGDGEDEVVMGISFCFPMKQTSLDEAILMPTGKGFALSSDLNLRQALLDGYECHTIRHDEEPTAKRQKRHALPKLKIAAMTNDTVATLASLAYSIKSLPNSRVVMGLIVGAGCNATVPMKLTDLHASKTSHIRANDPSATHTLVCTEWTLHGAAKPLRDLNLVTPWDTQLESHTDRPGFQPLEYMTGGRYIGELVRIVTVDYLTRELGIARSSLPVALTNKHNALTTDFLSLVVSPSTCDDSLCRTLAAKFPPPESSVWQWTASAAGALRVIASTVQTRSAALVAAATVGLLACTGEIRLHNDLDSGNNSASSAVSWQRGPEELVVAVSGGVVQHYPKFKETVQWQIDRLMMRAGPQDGGRSVFLREASDGGIIGVGVLAGTVAGKIEGIIGSTLAPTST
ncbi:hypothetical protein ASPWEDRAFT_109758 [Aspergillus wentii DTO 134E9]|uniref:Phosphotransferase n=1 Tax=Aspergillus wentii DTO 134E9 TaxID=1073089 RepID=A0A1L9RIP8_ASPWE|nr:uncharacterized protein ASPWEDRAFT_109758 [Aspergillus wentii DTO 134E9]OJJ34806.1 hypothetical protein ASPWEDRAFT_109758 [Aspergillus wentii DTO 134E9]